MVGMHGSYESNMAMHDCDLMINIGARFDDRITGRIDKFSPGRPEDPRRHRSELDQQERHGSICRSSATAGMVLKEMIRIWRSKTNEPRTEALAPWWKQIDHWRSKNSFGFKQSSTIIKPQHAIKRLYAATKDRYRHGSWSSQAETHRCGR